jgi:3-isopropylmalate dehydrogenase
VTCVDKANVFRSSAFFRRVFDEVAADYPDVEAEHLYVDAAALALVQRPQTFDVLVMENMYGDILSDLAAGLIGGLGLAPSGDVGADHAVFQPSHGTAPDIAGRGVANPLAMILSAAMMLGWLAERHGDAAIRRAGQAFDTAVAAALAGGAACPPDQGGNHTTAEVGDAVVERIGKAE